jgi:hypothetical protein
MSNTRKQYCDSLIPHASRSCLDCQRIVARIRRGQTLEEAKAPPIKEEYGPINIRGSAVDWLMNAARVFDAESPERFTAVEFMRWVKADLAGHVIPRDQFSGVSLMEGGSRNGSMAYRHTSPDPLPVMPRRRSA